MNTLQCLRTLEGHEDNVRVLAVGRGFLFSGSWDKTVRVWSAESLECVKVSACPSCCVCIWLSMLLLPCLAHCLKAFEGQKGCAAASIGFLRGLILTCCAGVRGAQRGRAGIGSWGHLSGQRQLR